MINRMIAPTSGAIWIDDRNAADFKVTGLRRGIGYVIQQAGLFPNKTVLDNVATVPQLLGQSRRAARATAHDLLEWVGLTADLGKRYPTGDGDSRRSRPGRDVDGSPGEKARMRKRS
jgi:osmoprotectant transport system ATP-binding protein